MQAQQSEHSKNEMTMDGSGVSKRLPPPRPEPCYYRVSQGILIFFALCVTVFLKLESINVSTSQVTTIPKDRLLPSTVRGAQQYEQQQQQQQQTQNQDILLSSGSSNIKNEVDMRDLSLVFMGDSITRYQYLSLVYYLRWQTWFDPTKRRPHLVEEGTFASPLHPERWLEFFWQTNRLLEDWETCDCYRPLGKAKRQLHKVCENRYFYDPARNVSITYIQAYGDSPQHGHYNASTAFQTIGKESIPLELKEYEWEYTTWSDTIRHYVAYLQPKPDFVIMNTAYWGNEFMLQVQTQQDLLSAFHDTGITPIWKTSTSGKNGYIQAHHELVDHSMCALLGNCLNLTWTRTLEKNMWWDFAHFVEPVYRRMNEQLLGMIQEQRL